ncbi:Inositol polyphosphate multikinase [Wickerhamomyces ciferrii]|uniref:Kinase n=1 Tax=Wickerhamomyces ciferrii (strain ATCC 14091 / BCRC 22168 / CBS 111 / JCM 3599 / NBRC 0793 / NRRL Y-1031 F-60-10) TaxID=1206466 RepID=K0KSQ4_WICCF|nr:Inositol polyphosphate multikinase [Wickerhamomyces ciferrii]CCH45077.1 Inositol polyphosphate multikinase [Wickerhamomyces ciferrii]
MEGFTKLEHQAAGHDGILVDESGTLFIKPSTAQEIEFYTQVHDLGLEEEEAAENSTDQEKFLQEGDRLVDYIPVFFGTLESGITKKVEETTQISDDLKQLDIKNTQDGKKSNDEKPYLVIKNLLHGYKNPSIIDIKLGAVLHDERTPDEKKERLQNVSKSTTSGSLNYRVCGQKLYHEHIPDLSKFSEKSREHVTKTDDGYLIFDKWFGRELTPDNVVENFKIYFRHNKLSKDQQDILLRNFYTRLQLLYNCLLSYEVRIRSGSLLFIYENDPKRWEELDNIDPLFDQDLTDEDDEEDDEDEEYKPSSLSSMTLIDFAHSKFTPGKGPDENIIQGIENLIDALDQLL